MRAPSPTKSSIRNAHWSISAESLIELLHSQLDGLTDGQASERLAEFGANRLQTKRSAGSWLLLFSQFKSPIIMILICAAILSLFLQDTTDALIILAIVLTSGLLGFWQEHSAANAVSKLRSMVEVKARVLRDGVEKVVPIEDVVPGDLILLSTGNIVPADCRLLETRDLFLSEATLTGETYPVEKTPGTLAAKTALAQRTNATWMGTHVISGSGKAIAVHTGRATEFGKVFDSLRLRPPQTEFERGI